MPSTPAPRDHRPAPGHSTTVLVRPDGHRLVLHRWLPAGEPVAAVQISHGMAEHALRYDELARRLAAQGWAVYADDHRGHGRTVTANEGTPGHLGDTGGFDTLVDDLHAVTDHVRAQYPGLPVVLLGHSMGSFLARAAVQRRDDALAGLVLSGTGGDQGVLGRLGVLVAATEGRLLGGERPSRLMNALTFGPFNRAFRPARTAFDWLSRDEAEVDAYLADPACGAPFTAASYRSLLTGLAAIHRDDAVRRTPVQLPVLLISGDADPVGGDSGAGVRATADALRRAGVRDVQVRLYPGARHELFHETNRDEVVDDLIAWLEARTGRN